MPDWDRKQRGSTALQRGHQWACWWDSGKLDFCSNGVLTCVCADWPNSHSAGRVWSYDCFPMASWLSSSALFPATDFSIQVQVLTTDFLKWKWLSKPKIWRKNYKSPRLLYFFISFKRHWNKNRIVKTIITHSPLFMFYWGFSSLHIRSDQSLSHVRLFATPWIAARQASLSITNPRSSLRLMSIESVMPSSHLILCRPLLLLPPIPPSISLFQWVNSSHEVAKVLEFQL